MSTSQMWWGRRRVAPEPEAMGYEAGALPFSFEPEETLGDTAPAPLCEPPSAAQLREARESRRIYFVVALFALLLYFGQVA